MDLKKFSIALVAVAGALILWHLWTAKQQRGRKGPTTQPTTRKVAVATKHEPKPPAPQAPPKPEPKRKPGTYPKSMRWVGTPQQRERPRLITIGSVRPKAGYMFAVELSNRGAAINTVKLARHFATVDDKRLYQKDPEAYEKLWPTKGKEYQGHYSLLNPVAHGGREFLPLATRGLKLSLKGPNGKTYPLALANLDKKLWRLVRRTDTSATFVYEIARTRRKTDQWDDQISKDLALRIAKTYTVEPNSHTVLVSLKVENLSDLGADVNVDQSGPTGLPREGVRADNRSATYCKRQADGETLQAFRKPPSELNPEKGKLKDLGRHVVVGTSHEATPTLWIGHLNQFFGSMMYPVMEKHEGDVWQAKFQVAAAEESDTSHTFLTGITIEGMELKAHTSKEVDFELFVGPKKRDLFTNEDHPQFRARYKELNYLSTLSLRECICAFNWLSLAMMWLLQKLSVVALGNYGVAIILLVALVRISLHPLTKKGQVSMMKMQKLAPQMQKLKEKYKDDKDTLNKEMMRFYKEQGATPILGCLPMMLQMPIWIALWTSVQASVELRHAAFLPVWITDLAAPDRLFTWSEALPLVGTSFNLLPILLTVAMFLQTKMNPQMGQTATTPQQQQQQKMMRYMMPAMMLFIFYPAPSGLTLYIMASTFAGVAEQQVIRRHIKSKDAVEAARETTVTVPGKGPRKSRPKKPKGPNWVKRG